MASDLLKKRAVLKGTLTRFNTFLNKVIQNVPIGESPHLSDIECQELVSRLENVKPLLAKFEELQTQIEPEIPDQVDDEEIAHFEDQYYHLVALGKSILNNATRRTADSNLGMLQNATSNGSLLVVPNTRLRSDSPDDVRSLSPASSSQSMSIRASIRLPALDIPKFSGNPTEWLAFRDIYVSVIHENNELGPIQKFSYLSASLVGKAKELISSFSLTSSNYEIAWKVLLDRYDSSKSLVFHHIKDLFNIETMNQESATKLRNLVDGVKRNMRSLDSLVDKDKQLETFLVYLIQSKLDLVTTRDFESGLNSNELPELDRLLSFIDKRATLMDTIEGRNKRAHVRPTTRSLSVIEKNKPVSNGANCPLCTKGHFLSSCHEFKALDNAQRQATIRKLHMCFNCFSKGHSVKDCRSRNRCLQCSRKHHSLLHNEVQVQVQLPVEGEPSVLPNEVTAFSTNSRGVLLPTIAGCVYDYLGKSHQVRILLDSGSMSSFVTSSLIKRLKLPQSKTDVKVQGITNGSMSINSRCNIEIQSLNRSFKMKVNCLVVQQITTKLPIAQVATEGWEIPSEIELADPMYSCPMQVDVLLGALHFFDILMTGKLSLGPDLPQLQNTKFGWIISGAIPFVNSVSHSYFCNTLESPNIDESLRKFWEIEEIPNTKPILSQEEAMCEEHFVSTIKRNEEGRFVVSIPFKNNLDQLGDSFEQAKSRFLNLERKLNKNDSMKGKYCEFMAEYEVNKHMTLDNSSDLNGFFLPHHGVLNENSVTTKLRVVFDGSAKTTTGVSLNACQLVGPVVQSSLFSILIRFRKYKYVFSSDIKAMYRQILIEEDQRKFQKILWRDSPDKPLQIYNLNTVTYGTASAPYLATRCLNQIGLDYAAIDVSLSKTISNSFYVDDCLHGTDDLTQAQSLCQSLSSVLSSYGFQLRKWLANEPSVLAYVNNSDFHPNQHNFGAPSKTLGLLWLSSSDELLFSVPASDLKRVTKRSILSDIAQIFDPLGLAAPCTMKAKFLLQSLWLQKLNWDDELHPSLQEEWISIRSSLPSLNILRFPRNCFGTDNNHSIKSVSVHGFSDASSQGYGACIYVRSVMEDNSVTCRLMVAKGRVAPIKQISIPRLELLGAVMLAKLTHQTLISLEVHVDNVVLWTDSTIVLSWLKMTPNRLHVFVANRIAQIQELTSKACWKHVPTKDNPSDMISRGLLPADLVVSKLWAHGPDWLILDESSWPNSKFDVVSIPEVKREINLNTVVVQEHFITPLFSNLNKLTKVVAWCLRFIHNSRKKRDDRSCGSLSVYEITESMNSLLKLSQVESFQSELESLEKKLPLKSGRLLKLNPFIDERGVLRVGGRLKNSMYNFDKKHPVIVCGNHPLASLIVSNEHIRLLHAGPQQLLFSIREKIWILSGQSLCKKIFRRCITCFKNNPKTITPIMGDLPKSRVDCSYPFMNTGVDFAGPFWLKDRAGKGSRKSKAYICVFVCMATKAVHLEIVSSLSTEAFLQCFKRFAARRGLPKVIHSDNGTNFVGARNYLLELGRFLKRESKPLVNSLAQLGITWQMTPSYSPHFGGLWEAGVKSMKFHLRRVIGELSLTFEEYNTVLCQVEAILNSRPLTPLSADCSDLDPLTPGHFLIGRVMTSVPEEDVTTLSSGRLSRFQHLQQVTQHFWTRWSTEYISQLQFRTKWHRSHGDLKVNTLVVIKQLNLPPLKWKLGRIVELHKGRDGIARVASVKVQSGIVKRSFASLCPLPLE